MSTKNKMQNAAENAKGQAKETLGKATDNEQWQAEGKLGQAKSDLKQAGEKVKDAIRS
jgi:uncharacterized protein YjbJ (UPF0337 family)